MDKEEVSDHGRGDGLGGRTPQSLEQPDDHGRFVPGKHHPEAGSAREDRGRQVQDEAAAEDVRQGDPEDVAEPDGQDVELPCWLAYHIDIISWESMSM